MVEVRIDRAIERSRRDLSINPSTYLPGPALIDREINRLLTEGENFAICYADIDNFKAFNDYFGYQKGDEIISYIAGVLTKSVEKLGSKQDFVGHIGGDDFVLVTDPSRGQFMAKHIIEEFDKGAMFLLSEEDVKRGYFEVRNRQGEIVEATMKQPR